MSSPEEGPEKKDNSCQNDRARTAMMVGETCADVNSFAQATNEDTGLRESVRSTSGVIYR